MINNTITLRRPDDWHLHLRDGAVLRAVLPYTAAVFGRAIIMPNLVPPVITVDDAQNYCARILAALPQNANFIPLMTCYLTDNTIPDEIRTGFEAGVFTAAKLYPAGATTHSESGVTAIHHIYPVLETMQSIGMPLLLHGEVVAPEVDIFDREAVFIERVLAPLRRDLPALRIVFEHITTALAVEYVLDQKHGLGATITPHHLMINRNALFKGGLRPHMYCLPVAKREADRMALRKAAASGDARFFLGTDSAPHLAHTKECDGGCAGIFNAPTALQCTAQVFDEERALAQLEAFVSLNGARFYGLEPNQDSIVLQRSDVAEMPTSINVAGESIKIFHPGEPLHWSLANN